MILIRTFFSLLFDLCSFTEHVADQIWDEATRRK